MRVLHKRDASPRLHIAILAGTGGAALIFVTWREALARRMG
jgi:hypothetical protein